MKQRCYNPKHPSYHIYGGRGIKICNRWLGNEGFDNFCEDMGKRPPKHSLDRINVNGNYTPKNCKWSTKKQQQNNRRDNRYITYQGVTKALGLWAEELGIERETLRGRLRYGWTVEKTLTTPIQE